MQRTTLTAILLAVWTTSAQAGSPVLINPLEDSKHHAVPGPVDVLKTPSPGGPVPIPYPNGGKPAVKDSNAATGKKTKISNEKASTKEPNFGTSHGDEAGNSGGVASSNVKGKAEFVNFSSDVKPEGKNVPHAFDSTMHNGGASVAAPFVPGGAVVSGAISGATSMGGPARSPAMRSAPLSRPSPGTPVKAR